MKRSPLKPSTKPLRRRKPLSKVSAKRKREGKTYAELRNEHLSKWPYCVPCSVGNGALLPGLRIATTATDVHHKAGRGRFYLRAETFMSCCRECHHFITDHRQWAEKMGYSLTVAERRALP